MPILNVQLVQVGEVGVQPQVAYVLTNDTLIEATTAGYLNKYQQNNPGVLNDTTMCLVATKTSPSAVSTQVSWYEVAYNVSTRDWSLTSAAGGGSVTLPTIANHIATYTNTTGGLSEDPSTAITGGNLQAGLSGSAGFVASFPATGAKGSFRFTAVANTGDTVTTFSNAPMGQASVISVPDPVNAIGRVMIAATATPFVSGNLPAASGTGGLMVDSGKSAAALATFTGATVVGNLVKASTTSGQISDQGFAMKSVAGAAAAGGAAAQSFTDPFCTSGSNVVGNWNTQANPASVLKIVPGNGSFVVTSDVDAGVATFNYIITK